MKRLAGGAGLYLAVVALMFFSLPTFAAETAVSTRIDLFMCQILADNPELQVNLSAMPKGASYARTIVSPGRMARQRYTAFSVNLKIAPVSQAALSDLCINYDTAALAYQSVSYTVKKNYIAVSVGFTATGAPGSTIVRFYSAMKNAVKRNTKVTIKPVPVKSVALDARVSALAVGETAALTSTVLPENASNLAVKWYSSNKNVATVSESGLVTARKRGTATITAKTISGGRKATCKILVSTPPPTEETVYRALMIGNEAYSSRLHGPYNDLAAMQQVLSLSSINGQGYANVIAKKDRTRSQILSDIASLNDFGIDSNDVTLFYYSGHGGRASSTESGTGLVGVDRKLLNVPTLKSALDKIPGTVIVVLDACYSGMFIGKSAAVSADEDQDFDNLVMQSFAGPLQKKGLTTSKYHVITACRKGESSVSVGFSNAGRATYIGLATYYLTIAGGYDLLNPSASAFAGDASGDGTATFGEVFAYADAAVDAFRTKHKSLGITQDMRCYTSDADLPLFGRS